MLLKHFRNLLLVKIAGDGSSSFDIAPEQLETLKVQTEKVSRETLQRYLDILLGEADALRRSQEARMKIEAVLVRLAYLEPVLPVGEILATLESLEQRIKAGSPAVRGGTDEGPAIKQPSEIRKAAAQDDPGIPRRQPDGQQAEHRPAEKPGPDDDLKKWINKENPLLGAKIAAAEWVKMENGCLTLGFPQRYLFLDNLEKQHKEELERIAGRYYAQQVSLKVVAIEAPKANGNGGSRNARANNFSEIKREAVNSPLFQKVLAEFDGAELVEIKPITDKNHRG